MLREPGASISPPDSRNTQHATARRTGFVAALTLLLLARPASSQARVVEARLFSPSLGTTKRAVVYLPPSYATQPGRRYPVLYYLHGMWGGEWDWARHGRLDAAMDSLAARGAAEAIVVMPDGDDGWYTTWNVLAGLTNCPARVPASEPAARYCVPWARYDDYVARDLVARVDSGYRTLPARAHRGVAGLSMGGYGAVSLAVGYPTVFSAAASHSGALAPLRRAGPRPPTIPELAAAWGPEFWPYLLPAFGRDTLGWWARDPARALRRLRDTAPALVPSFFIDVGTGDYLLPQSRAFRDSLAAMKLPHRYAEWPGAHSWPYWRAHVGESLAWLLARVAPAAGAPAVPAASASRHPRR